MMVVGVLVCVCLVWWGYVVVVWGGNGGDGDDAGDDELVAKIVDMQHQLEQLVQTADSLQKVEALLTIIQLITLRGTITIIILIILMIIVRRRRRRILITS